MLVLKCQVLPFSWALTLLACCLGLRGSCPVVTLPGVPLWFFRTWWGSVELPRTSGGRVFCLIARLSPGLGLALAFWVFHVWVFSGSPSGSGCSVLCFRHVCDVVLRALPCSSVGGLHCTGQREINRMREGYSLWGRSGLPGLLGVTHRRRCMQFILPQVVA